QKCVFTDPTVIPTGGKTEVLVAGGGTAGAVAAIGALEKGAQAQVVDYFNDLGGTKTMGGVMGYYLGITDNNYIRNLESEITSFSAKCKLTGNIGRRVYFQDKIIKAGGEFISGSIICGTVTEGKHVKGI